MSDNNEQEARKNRIVEIFKTFIVNRIGGANAELVMWDIVIPRIMAFPWDLDLKEEIIDQCDFSEEKVPELLKSYFKLPDIQLMAIMFSSENGSPYNYGNRIVSNNPCNKNTPKKAIKAYLFSREKTEFIRTFFQKAGAFLSQCPFIV
jgi:hypothetical protein